MNRITAMRKRCGLSQDSIAEKLGIDRSTVSKWESGDRTPQLNNLIELAKILGCSVDDLLSQESKAV